MTISQMLDKIEIITNQLDQYKTQMRHSKSQMEYSRNELLYNNTLSKISKLEKLAY